MWSVVRSRTFSSSPATQQKWKLGFSMLSGGGDEGIRAGELLKLEEVETILRDVKADNVKVIPIPKHCDFADFMVVATGRSAWHVRNIAQALIYKAGKLVIHALDEKVRAYYNLEKLWSTDTSNQDHGLVEGQDLEKAFLKVRPKNNSKKRPSTSA